MQKKKKNKIIDMDCLTTKLNILRSAKCVNLE